ncbi:MAG: flagellar basal body-associated FliL family protein [Woeseiaceae bacterium]
MADEELELDVDVKKKKSPWIMVVVAIVLLNGIGIGAWMFLGGGGDDKSAKHEKAAPDSGPLKYLTMVPEFIVNFGPGSRVRYLQVDLQVASRDGNALDIINTYRPVIRNDILVDLSSVDYKDLVTRSGKEKLQKKLLNTINRITNTYSHGGDHGEKKNDHAKDADAASSHGSVDEKVKGPVEAIYFTSFIMQ